jgi:hypothetical protein
MSFTRDGCSSAKGDVRRRQARRARFIAWSVSTTLHLSGVVLLLSAASGQMLATPNDGTDGVMNVTLVSAASFADSPPASAQSPLAPLFARLDTGAPPVTIEPDRKGSDLSRLMGAIQHRQAQPATVLYSNIKRQPERTDHGSNSNRDGEDAATADRAGGRAGSTGGLWGQIEPCWTRLRGRASVPVTIEIALDAAGKLSTPPKIIRAAGVTPDQRRLQAEALALSALTACMPHGGDLRFSGKTYRIDFTDHGSRNGGHDINDTNASGNYPL